MRYIFKKDSTKLTEQERWYLNRYLEMSPILKKAYELKEEYHQWFQQAKKEEKMKKIKEGLEAFYRKVLTSTPNEQFLLIYDEHFLLVKNLFLMF